VVTADQLDSATRAMAARIARHSPAAIASGKRLLRDQMGLPAADAYALAAENMARDMQTIEAQSGIDAFLHK
jgi:enoyl-CoA hydratase/carnithine racemase